MGSYADSDYGSFRMGSAEGFSQIDLNALSKEELIELRDILKSESAEGGGQDDYGVKTIDRRSGEQPVEAETSYSRTR